ncbi:MAG TPA: urease accessory protein UreD [Xanthobacteraceae bacterium]|nr:urease accessory protein UreD [Xanthobacteraceae bacterium]
MPPQAVPAISETFAANRSRGRVAITVEASRGRSRRTQVYEDGALRVRFPNGDDLEAMIVNTAGGMAGGDSFSLEFVANAKAALTVTTAAAEKVYRSLGDDTVIDVRLEVGPGASLHWLPQETILFDAAQLRRSIEIDLATGAGLLAAEALVFGRTAMDETVSQGRLFDRWRVRREGKLFYADTARLGGNISEVLARRAVAAGAIAIATVLIAPGDDSQVNAVREQNYAGEVGISCWNGIALARLAAKSGEALRRDLRLVLQAIGGELPRLWLN